MNFLSEPFLAAMVAAAGPAVIHLLNRRRFRTKQWAAMQFLREAMRRNRKAIEIRDLVLLAIRTLIIILLILAMSRPYWTRQSTGLYRGEKVHAVLILDNSLSMGYVELDLSLLDRAKKRAKTFIESLPAGSDVSIIPLCDQKKWSTRGAFVSPDDAIVALSRIQPVDRNGSFLTAAEAAKRECSEGSDIPTKRVVIFSDMQEMTLPKNGLGEAFSGLEDVQLVAISGSAIENAWVSDFYLRDGIADTDSAAVFHGAVHYQGTEDAFRVQASLSIDGISVDEKSVQLTRGQPTYVSFSHRFDSGGTSERPLFVRASLEITSDRLHGDDSRMCVVPVLNRIPVVFADQVGSQEDVARGRYGESYVLRQMFSSDDENAGHLVDTVHRTSGTITREDLQDARLVVIAGTQPPPDTTQALLMEYVQQGGQLLITAGGDFNPAVWTSVAWRNGEGILPAPLKNQLIGRLPERNGAKAVEFKLDPATFSHPIYRLELSDEERDDLLTTPSFYQAVEVDEEGWSDFSEQELKRVKTRLENESRIETRLKTLAGQSTLSNKEKSEQAQLRQEADRLQASWLTWTNPLVREFRELTPEQRVAMNMPRVLGRYDNGKPFAVERRIGKGHTFLVTSGSFPVWNTVVVDTGILLFDRVLRKLLQRSLPALTMGSLSELVVPVPSRQRTDPFQVLFPGDKNATPIGVESLDARRFGVVLRAPTRRGFYELSRVSEKKEDQEPPLLLAFNGPANESRLEYLGEQPALERIQLEHVRWVGANDKITLEGKTYVGMDSWRWLWILMIVFLGVEMWLLRQRRGFALQQGASAPLAAEGSQA